MYKEKSKVIYIPACYVCTVNAYMYTATTFLGLLWIMLTQWKHDRHMVG